MKKWTFIIAAFLLLSAQWLYSQTSISAVSTFSRTEDFINSSGLHRYNVIVQLDAANSTGFDIYYTFSTTDITATAGDDYEGHSNTQVRIPVGATIRHAVVEVYPDTDFEPDEQFLVTITSAWIDDGLNTPLPIGNATCTVTMENDDFDISVQVQDLTIDPEGSDAGTPPAFNYTRSFIYFDLSQLPPPGYSFVLTWQFNDGTADLSADYLAPLDGTLTITSSSANPTPSTRREVRIVPDLLNESDEDFTIEITSFQVLDPQGAAVSGLTLDSGDPGTVTINDDDPFDLIIHSKSVAGDPSTVFAGDEHTYLIEGELIGPGIVPLLTVTDHLPAGVIFLWASHSGAYDPGTHTVTWTVTNAGPGTETLQIGFEVDSSLPEGTLLYNEVCAEAERDGNTENNCADNEITVILPDVDCCGNLNSDKNVGQPPLLTKFEVLKPLTSYKWWVDLDKRSNWDKPRYIYQYPVPPAGPGKTYDIRMDGPVADSEVEDFIRVYEPGGFGRLQLVDATHTTSACPWENAIDGDVYWWDGTTEAGIDASGTAWAIFEFIDQGTRPIHTIRLLTDTGVDCLGGIRVIQIPVDFNGDVPIGDHVIPMMPMCNIGKQVTDFEVWVSTDGIDYTRVLAETKDNNVCTPCEFFDDWMTWHIDPVDAKFIKLVLLEPKKYSYIALGEFEVWYDAHLADAAQSSIEVNGNDVTLTVKDAAGDPISGLTCHDIVFYSYNTDGYYGDPHTALGVLNGEEPGKPGVYTGTVVNKGVVRASVNGVLIPGTAAALLAADQGAVPLSESPELVEAMPTEFALEQNYPNPFNPQTTIHYQLPEEVQVNLTVYDINGRIVETLVNGVQPAGYHSAVWHSRDRSSGIYFYHLTAGNYRAIRRMALVR